MMAPTPATSLVERYRVRIAGVPDASRTLVLSHGFGTDQSVWQCLLPGLERDFRVVLFDHAALCPNSAVAGGNYRCPPLQSLATEVVQLAEELRLHDCILVGHSAGGLIALLAAIDAPARFAKLVLLGTTLCYRNEPDYKGGLNDEDFVELYRLMLVDYEEWMHRFVPHVTGKKAGQVIHDYLRQMLGRLSPQQALAVARTVLEADYRDWAFLVNQPTLILQAREDPIVPPGAAEFLHRQIRASRLEILEANGHFAFADVPDEVVRAIRTFV